MIGAAILRVLLEILSIPVALLLESLHKSLYTVDTVVGWNVAN